MISWFPSFFPLLGGILLSAIEFSIGIFLFFGIKKTISTTLASVSYTHLDVYKRQGLNAGHDLSLVNLNYFYKNIPWVDEVAIGHALISDALYLGLDVYKRQAYIRSLQEEGRYSTAHVYKNAVLSFTRFHGSTYICLLYTSRCV